MSREIKFRALVRYEGMKNPVWEYYTTFRMPAWLDFGEVIIKDLQYTGLRDKNNIEIYEGDIVEMDNWNPSNYQISFIEAGFCLADCKGEYAADIHYIYHAGIKQAAVIGNIHQNPELI